MKYLTVLGLVLGLTQPATALELFGVSLESAGRDELREATREAGLVLIREGGHGHWFDVYDSNAVLSGSTRFYLGFVKQDQRFAFAEYEFVGLNAKRLLHDLTIKYGVAKTRAGRYVSDRSYRWQRDGVDIELRSDWQNYKTRLSYVIPENMAELLAEQSAQASQAEEATQVSLY